MTETPGDPSARPGPGIPKDPVQLLIEALGTLPQPDRDAVYAWLLRRDDPLPAPGAGPGQPLTGSLGQVTTALFQPGGAGIAQSVRTAVASGQQMVPVRFPTEQHAQLREWCAEHGFSMATVIRGLVARFLEGQLPGTGGEPPPSPA